MQKLKIGLLVAIVWICCAVPGIARAQTCNNTLIGGLFYGGIALSSTSLSFGNYMPAAVTPLSSTFVITARCSGGLVGGTLPPYTIALNAGSGSFTQRMMKDGTAVLKYQIYTSAALSAVWGDGTGTTSTVAAGNDSATTDTITGYGVVTPGQFVLAGSYTDTITITVTY
jgi:spore coat protein U-like protein